MQFDVKVISSNCDFMFDMFFMISISLCKASHNVLKIIKNP